MAIKTKAPQRSNDYGHVTACNGRADDAYHSDWNTSGGDCGSQSPLSSPRRHPNRFSRCQHRRRLMTRVRSFAMRRRSLRYLILLPMLYASGLLLCVEKFSELVGLSPLPGSVYRSPELFEKLWEDIQADNTSAIELSSIWKYKSRSRKLPKPCPNSTAGSHLGLEKEASGPTGYLIIDANGGLNQQRSAICNAVAVAGLLNAVLVIPRFEFNSVWRDPSQFVDIYDEDHFIATLEGHVKVVRELPDDLMARYNYTIANIANIRVQAWAPISHYMREVYPILVEQGVIRIAPFANRLAMHVPPYTQFLRCMTNYKALRFSSPILTLAEKLISRMIEKSSQTGGKYVSVHLRFEEDMVAFSCCVYDGGKAERSEMDLLREKGWKGKFKRRDRIIRPGHNRINGKCPLTPLEVGMMLRGMGFSNTTSIYLASGKVYKAERHLKPLLKMFPFVYTKESLATPEELSPFEEFSSRTAALDYMVCLLSEVFVTTQGGNFPHFLMGHRRFFFGGHAKTVIPDKPKLALLLQDMDISWASFKNQMELMLKESDRKSIMVPKVTKINRKTSIFMYPLPECQCLRNSADQTPRSIQALDAFASTNSSIMR